MYIYKWRVQSLRQIKQNTEAKHKKITKHRKKKCASKGLAVCSSIELSMLLVLSELLQVLTASNVEDLLLL